MVKILAPNIREISIVSSINVSKFLVVLVFPSRSNFSQYSVSFALLSAISKNLINSLFELEAFASIMFAPMEVADLTN